MEYTVQESEVELGGQKGKGHLPTALFTPKPPFGGFKIIGLGHRIPHTFKLVCRRQFFSEFYKGNSLDF